MSSAKEEMFERVIMGSREYVHDNIKDLPDYAGIVEVGAAMIAQLLVELGDLAEEVMLDGSWIAGFTAGIATSCMITNIEGVTHSSYPCPENMDHMHMLIDLDAFLAYADTAAFGLIEGHYMYKSLKGMTDGEQ